MKPSVRDWLIKNWPFPSAKKNPPSVPAGTRIYAIGDIHGRIDLLDAVLGRIDDDVTVFPAERVIHVFLGDYIDRGPNSRDVLDRLIARSETHETIFLKGNHEALLLEFLKQPTIFDDWRQLGAVPTLISYGLAPPSRMERGVHEELATAMRQRMPAEHNSFLTNLRTTFVCGDYFFVHAGVRPGVRLTDQKEEDLLWIRDEFLESNTDFGKVVVHGHSPVAKPEMRRNRINIDTGAYASGNLTCLVVEGDKLSFL